MFTGTVKSRQELVYILRRFDCNIQLRDEWMFDNYCSEQQVAGTGYMPKVNMCVPIGLYCTEQGRLEKKQSWHSR